MELPQNMYISGVANLPATFPAPASEGIPAKTMNSLGKITFLLDSNGVLWGQPKPYKNNNKQ